MTYADPHPLDAEAARAEAAPGTSAPTALGLLKALRRRWLLASTVGVLGTVIVAGLAWFLLPAPSQTARALLLVASDQPRVLFTTSEAHSEAGAFRQTQMALLKSRLVLNAALRQAKVAELSLVRERDDAVAWLERELKVAAGASPEILSVSLSGDRPGELKALVDAVVAAYMQEIVNKDHVKRQTRLDNLKTIAAQYDEQLRRKQRRTLRELAENVGSSDKQALAMKQVFTLEQYHLTRKELLQVRSDLRRLQTEAAGAAEGTEPELPEQAIGEFLQTDPLMVQYQTQKLHLEDEMEQAKRNLIKGADHPTVKRYMEDIAATKQLIERRREELRPRMEARIRERSRLDLAAYSSQLRKRTEFSQRLEKQLAEEVKRLEEEARALNKGSIDLGMLQTEIGQAEEVARKVAEEVEKLTVELQGAPPRVNVLEEAIIDTGEGRMHRLRNTAAASLAFLGLFLLVVSWWEFRTHRIETVEQVVNDLGLKLVGTLPPQRANAVAGQGAFHESVAAARTMLLHMARSEPLQVVMVSSAVAGEGKTSLASQLSASLASAGHKVLLVDADLRKPDAHHVFSASSAPGLSELLRGEVAVARVVQRTSVSNLWLLAAGSCDGRALQALSRGRLKEGLVELREMFEFVILDSSPVLPLADAVQVGQHVDGVVLSVLRNVSRLPRVHAAAQRLTQLGVRVLGAVVLGAQAETDGYGYTYATAEAK